ncbi:MAG: hypothetical protein QM622_05870, partial [Microbacterium sp.]
ETTGDPRSLGGQLFSHEQTDADVVIVAADGLSAATLLATAGVAVTPPPAPVRDVVTLLVDAPGLDGGPRGAAVYPVPGAAAGVVATGLVHATATWPTLARAAGPGRHVLRVSLPAHDAGEIDRAAPDDLVRTAAAQAELLTAAGPLAVRAAAHRRAVLQPPASLLGHDERVAEARAAIARQHGLAAVGAWLSGGGVAAVVGDAIAQAERVRRRALWSDAPGADDGS